MKNFVCLFLILAAAAATFAQKTFEVQDFSNDYYGKLYLETPSEVFSKGWVAIYEKRTNRQLIKVFSNQLIGETEDGKIKANVRELPYGEQSVIIYDDFNFDGIRDFAVMDGQNSCYGGPSFQIYLAAKVKGRFALNPSFTRLAQDYCGMFEVDAAAKKIKTMTKSGCCWHQFSEFIVAGGTPKAVKIVEEQIGFPFNTVSTETWNGKKMVRTFFRSVDLKEPEIKVLLSFKTAAKAAEVVLYSDGEELNYLFIDKAGNVELAYPADAGEEKTGFTLDSKENPAALYFTNKRATYKIYQTGSEKIGVEVSIGGRRTDLSGEPSSRKGSLRELLNEKLTNVAFK